jgi:hypothetical protein
VIKKGSKNNLFLSNFRRYFLLSFIIISSITGTIFISLYDYSNKNKISLILEDNQENFQYIHNKTHLEIDFIKNDLLVFSQNENLINWVSSNDSISFVNFTYYILNHVRTLQFYDQIRYIDKAGFEKIRVNFNGSEENSFIVPESSLQDKSNRYYFKESIILNKNEIYISPLDLNIEYSQIEIPFKPIIRFATPVFNEFGIKTGIFIINYLANDLLNELHILNKNDALLYLTDDLGHYIINPNHTKEWGQFTGLNDSFKVEEPEVWQKIYEYDTGSVIHQKEIFIYYNFSALDSKLFSNGNYYSWILIVVYNNSYIHSLQRETINSLLSILVVYYLLFIILSFGISIKLANKKLRDVHQNEMIMKTNLLLSKQKRELSEFAQLLSHDIKNYLYKIRLLCDAIQLMD